MSLDGGLDELLEFFSSFASRASNSAIRASSTAQFAHRVAATRSSIATPHYPNHLSPTKITLETVNGYRKSSGKPWYFTEILEVERLKELPEGLVR